jgi:hypothetical protein
MDPLSVQWAIGIVVTVAIAVVGGFIKYLFSVVNSHKQETADHIERLRIDVEARRQETRDTLLQLINTKFDAIWESIRDLKDKVS